MKEEKMTKQGIGCRAKGGLKRRIGRKGPGRYGFATRGKGVGNLPPGWGVGRTIITPLDAVKRIFCQGGGSARATRENAKVKRHGN